jgi:hypothetical protein
VSSGTIFQPLPLPPLLELLLVPVVPPPSPPLLVLQAARTASPTSQGRIFMAAILLRD